VSTANDDANLFVDPAIGRFPGIEEDEPAAEPSRSEQQTPPLGLIPSAAGWLCPFRKRFTVFIHILTNQRVVL